MSFLSFSHRGRRAASMGWFSLREQFKGSFKARLVLFLSLTSSILKLFFKFFLKRLGEQNMADLSALALSLWTLLGAHKRTENKNQCNASCFLAQWPSARLQNSGPSPIPQEAPWQSHLSFRSQPSEHLALQLLCGASNLLPLSSHCSYRFVKRHGCWSWGTNSLSDLQVSELGGPSVDIWKQQTRGSSSLPRNLMGQH